MSIGRLIHLDINYLPWWRFHRFECTRLKLSMRYLKDFQWLGVWTQTVADDWGFNEQQSFWNVTCNVVRSTPEKTRNYLIAFELEENFNLPASNSPRYASQINARHRSRWQRKWLNRRTKRNRSPVSSCQSDIVQVCNSVVLRMWNDVTWENLQFVSRIIVDDVVQTRQQVCWLEAQKAVRGGKHKVRR